MERLGCRQSNKPGEKEGYDKRTAASRHGSSHTRFFSGVNVARVFRGEFTVTADTPQKPGSPLVTFTYRFTYA
jgi:hypothetical protein